MLREGERPDEMLALRLWSAPASLQPADSSTGSAQTLPLWIGSVQTLQHTRAFNYIGMWRPLREAGSSLEALNKAVQPLPHQIAPHPETGHLVLRIRTDGLAE